jgi:hypothetical protein
MNVDSLKALIAIAEGKGKYEVLYNIAYELFDVDNNKAEKYAKEAYTLALTLRDSLS